MHTYLRYRQRQAVQVLRQLYGVSEKEGISARGPYKAVQCAAKRNQKNRGVHTEEHSRQESTDGPRTAEAAGPHG